MNSFNFFRIFFIFISTLFIIGISIITERKYAEKNAYFPDPSIFYYQNIQVYKSLLNEESFKPLATRYYMAINQLKDNKVNPFRTVFTIIVSPKLFIYKYSHLLSLIFIFFVFIFLLYYSIKDFSSNANWALGITLLFLSGPNLIHFRYGLAQYWLDTGPGLLMGSSILLLLLWYKHRNVKFLLLIGFLALVGVSSRYISLFFIFLLIGPPMALLTISEIILFKRYQVLQHSLALVFSVLLISGYFIFSNFEYTYKYYTTFSYGYNFSVAYSFYYFLQDFIMVFRVEYWLFIIVSFFLFRRISSKNISNKIEDKNVLIMGIYSMFIIPIFLIIVLKSGRNTHVYNGLYSVFFVSLYFIFFRFSKIVDINWKYCLSIAFIFPIYWVNIFLLNINLHKTLYPVMLESKYKSIDTNICNYLSNVPIKPVRIYSTIKEAHSLSLSNSLFYDHNGALADVTGSFFSSKKLFESGLKSNPKPVTVLANELDSNMRNAKAFFITLADSTSIYNSDEYKDSFSKDLVFRLWKMNEGGFLSEEVKCFESPLGPVKIFKYQ